MYILIDSPLTMFSTKKEIEAWIKELKALKQTSEVLIAIEEAERYLKK